jgi:DNA-binding CsgD family transcriptional regulator/tetratricopeptide (TPR) repeat protein
MELLGREQERAAICELIAAARQGGGGALVLRGEPGVGLTALLEHAVRGAPGMRVAQIRGVRPERDLEFAAVHQLCASMLDRLDALPARQRDTLAWVLGLVERRVEDGPHPGLAVLALLSCAAQEEPLLCVVDDAHWLDAPSAEAVAFAARRSDRQRIAFVVAVHEPATGAAPFAGIRELEVPGLPPDVSGKLLASAVSGPLDAGVRDRLIADTAGNPLALLHLSAQLTPEQLAGLAALPPVLPVGDALRERFLGPVRDMPTETQRLLVLAAADPDATTSALWSAAATLGLSADSATPAEATGVLRLSQRIRFRHPLIRLAIYDRAPVAERQRVHEALIDALDPELESDRRAWHRAAASLTPDEDVAAALEGVAAGARGRGDYMAAADLLERAAGLTPDAGRRYGRTLAAAQSALAAGALARAAALVDSAFAATLDELQRAQTQRLRGAISVALGQGADRPTVLLRAARALEPLEPRLARDSYLEALEAAVCSGEFGSDRSLSETAEAGRSAPPAPASRPSVADPLLDGLALLITAGHDAAVPTIRRAIEALLAGDEPRWLPLGLLAALEIWDDEALHDLRNRQAELTPTAEAPTPIPFALSHLGDMDAVVSGRFATTTTSLGPGELIAAAWASAAGDARDLVDACMREAFARELGLHIAFAHLATAVLELGLGHYEAALTAARAACKEPGLCVVTSALPELIEAAVRAGEREAAVSAVGRLSERALASGTHWALGTLARSRALLEAGARAEELYTEAIEHLRQSRAAPQLARAHLVYGEWLRRERRRRAAREQLRTARDMFVFMGAQGFAERARGELTATGEHARRRVDAPAELLTEHEARIARLVCEGATNAAIAAQLFISPRTVEYHLHKAFRKLDVSSRTQLARLMLESDDAPTP